MKRRLSVRTIAFLAKWNKKQETIQHQTACDTGIITAGYRGRSKYMARRQKRNMKLVISLAAMAASVLLYRWGMGVSSPRYDSYYVIRALGWCERALTRVDAWLVRCKVSMIDRLELDRVAWIRLRAQYVPSMS